MKTVFRFTESISKEKVILYHSKDIKITEETHKNHRKCWDQNGNIIEYENYIIIRYPKSKELDWSKWKMDYDNITSSGYHRLELDDEIELRFYNQMTFTWIVRKLEVVGLFKVVQRIIPNWKESGEFFPMYINAKGIRQWSFNIVFGLMQLPFVIYKEKQFYRKLKLKEELK